MGAPVRDHRNDGRNQSQTLSAFVGIRSVIARRLKMYQFTVKYTEQVAHAAVRASMVRSIRKKLNWKRQGLLLFTATVLIYSYVKYGISWIDTAVASVCLFGLFFLFFLYRNLVSQSLSRLRKMKSPVGEFILTEENFTVSTELGSSTLPWSSVESLAEHNGFWLLYMSPTSALTLPTVGIDTAVLNFVREKMATSATRA